MSERGVILYGPPTSGKDTVTAELTHQNPRYALLPKLKVGTGRSTGYRYVSPAELAALRDADRIAVETPRYGNVYAVDRHDITALTDADRIPVVHMGNVADLRRLRGAVPLHWTSVLLWVPRDVCAERSEHRGDDDTASRLRAWDETRDDVGSLDNPVFNLVIHTDRVTAAEAARRIVHATSFADAR